LLDQQIGTDLNGSNALVGDPIPQLAVSTVAPGIGHSTFSAEENKGITSITKDFNHLST
jgi:hypothetical protein